ncbi:unnamed protein product [Microthlaspi erraticum]|uniref:Uncharacterized protein n=1 Tax=Microthlaspi erraticum TaxID=1685480 RepID=A0A6D2HWD0_9BRAS|nr:unnamed protein product [Microthlaspi erraticum]
MTRPSVVWNGGIEKKVLRVCFHPKNPWIIAGFESGEIQIWNYRNSFFINQVSKHKGAVRGLDIHKSRELVVSGGDDKKIRVWNFMEAKSSFRLKGHESRVKTVEFHTQEPWIVSASEDKTVRIWNWMSRKCICVLRHRGPVNSASFHSELFVVVSASSDKTVCLWKIDGLRVQGMSTDAAALVLKKLEELPGAAGLMLQAPQSTTAALRAYMAQPLSPAPVPPRGLFGTMGQ